MDELEQHILWISRAIHRILNGSLSSSPLLSLSFARILPPFPQISHLSVPITLSTLSNGNHYALITSVLTSSAYENRSPAFQFENIMKLLNDIGFKPQQPCTIAGLLSTSERDHINLCRTLEFVVCDKSLSIERLLDDLRKMPRSFFVLREYPTHINDAVSLWLSKFPCIANLPEIANLQSDVSSGVHVAAVLSRIFPTRISKNDIMKQTSTEYWEESKLILEELNAFVPKKFPVTDHLFMCFISDLYYATRTSCKKFVRIEGQICNNCLMPKSNFRPTTTAIAKQVKITRSIQQARPKTCPTVFRPSPRRIAKLVTEQHNDEADLLQLFTFMRRGERRERFSDVENPILMIKPLCKLLSSPQHEQTFMNFWKQLDNCPQVDLHYKNGHAFLNGLSGNNNEFAASRKIVYFARQMMQTYQPIHNFYQTKPIIYKRVKRNADHCSNNTSNSNFNTNNIMENVSKQKDSVFLKVLTRHIDPHKI
ncbi:hypothetical protein TRFO_07933 [Tritrichomonas foetus]|uniref:Uncharacterized protein n=1 Tax=Tritrichomonas foetus TaxID=1144522 RepID=A0A1J4JTJ0_9EUKA|nr:hypothetical protein TRFO_07933 [Tritrichomonas foetus]|eukprot:OHT00589.1 hypothetical protein TRFO_07933 [Tritrichomonas foetus]